MLFLRTNSMSFFIACIKEVHIICLYEDYRKRANTINSVSNYQ